MHEKKTAVKHMGKIKPRSKRGTGRLLVGKGPDITVTSLRVIINWVGNVWNGWTTMSPEQL